MDALVPVITGTWVVVASLVAGAVLLYRKFKRPRQPVDVNCWFCGEDTKVPFGNQDCWDCPNCEQYNGFTVDGDYNKPIPAQFMEELNHPVTAENKTPPRKRWMPSEPPPLCDLCNNNQILKVHQLADFVPENELTYEIEVNLYKAYLERVYGLCPSCEHNVNDVIGEQDKILAKKLSHLKKDEIVDTSDGGPAIQEPDVSASDSILNDSTVVRLSTPWPGRILRYLACLWAFLLTVCGLYNLLAHSQAVKPSEVFPGWVLYLVMRMLSATFTLIITGLFSELAAVFISGKYRVSCRDAINILLWVCLLALIGLPLNMVLDHSDLYLGQFVVSVLNLLSSLWCTFVPRISVMSNRRFIKKRCRSPNTSGVSSTSGSLYDYSPAPSTSGGTTAQRRGHSSTISESNLYTQKSPKQNRISQEDDYLDRLETFSVGSASRRSASHIRAFGQFGDTRMFLNNSSNQPSNRPRHLPDGLLNSRPLISPAKFKPTVPSFLGNNAFANAAFQQSVFGVRHCNSDTPSTGFTTLADLSTSHASATSFNLPGLRVPGAFDDRASLFSEPRSPTQPQETDDSSSSSSHSSNRSRPRFRVKVKTEPNEGHTHSQYQQQLPPKTQDAKICSDSPREGRPGRMMRIVQAAWICITILLVVTCLGGYQLVTNFISSALENDTDEVVVIDPSFTNFSAEK